MMNVKTKLVKEAKNDKASRCWFAYQKKDQAKCDSVKCYPTGKNEGGRRATATANPCVSDCNPGIDF